MIYQILKERLCINCIKNEIEDEFQALNKCTAYTQARQSMTDKLCDIFPTYRYISLDDEAKFIFLMKANDFDIVSYVKT